MLYVIKPMLALNTYKFSFEVTNPAAGQASPSVSIEVNGYNSRINRVIMEKPGDIKDPLVITGFAMAAIGVQLPQKSANHNSLLECSRDSDNG